MGFTLGKGFGLFDFDGDGRLNPIGGNAAGAQEAEAVMRQFLIDEELAHELLEGGVDLGEFFTSDEEVRREMLEDAGLDPDDLDFDIEEFFGDDDDEDDDDDGLIGGRSLWG